MDTMFGRRSPSAPGAFASAVLVALLITACGVESKDDAVGATTTTIDESATSTTAGGSDTTVDETTTTEEEATTSTEDRSTDTTSGSSSDGLDEARDQVIDLYRGMGLDDEQATCLADKIIDSGLTDSADVDPTEALDWFADCDISISDLDMGAVADPPGAGQSEPGRRSSSASRSPL